MFAERPLAGVLVAFAVSAGAASLAFRPAYAGTPTFVGILLGGAMVVALLGLLQAREDGELAEWLRPRWGNFTGGALTAALLFAITYGIVKGLAPEGSIRQVWLLGLYVQLGPVEALRTKMPLVGAAIVLFAIADGIAWRGLVPSLLASKVGSRRAWIATGLLYGLAYAPAAWMLRVDPIGPNLILGLSALATGLVLAGATRLFRQLVPSIIAHALFMWFALTMFRFTTPSV